MENLSPGQTRKNLGANLLYFITNIIIGIFLVPFFVSSLGIAAYGIIPLASSLIGYVGILTDSLNSAVSRHLTIDLQSPNRDLANCTFNSAFFGLSKIIIMVIPVIIVISYFAPLLFGVSSDYSADAFWLFIGIGLAFLLRAWSSNFTVTLYGSNRLDLINIVNLSNIIVQMVFIFSLFSLFKPSLVFVGLAYLFGAVAATLSAYIFHKRSNHNLSIDYADYDGSKFSEMANMGGWIVINQIGSLLLLNIDLLVVNYLYGNAVGGEYSIAFQWVTLIRGLATTFVAILGPIILISYANGQKQRIISISKSAVKLIGIGIALPVGFICGFAPYILTFWVGAQYAYLAPLMIILTFHLVINTAVMPLFQINVAFNKVRLPAIITVITGAGVVPLAFILAVSFGWGIYGAAAAVVINLTLKNIIFTPLYAAVVMKIPKGTFYSAVIPGALATASITFVSYIISQTIWVGSLLPLVTVGCSIALAYAILTWKYFMNKDERALLPIPMRLN